MTRTLYQGLVRLHPLAFREEFGAEMQWIFDETSANGVIALFADALASLLRQWIVRYGTVEDRRGLRRRHPAHVAGIQLPDAAAAAAENPDDAGRAMRQPHA